MKGLKHILKKILRYFRNKWWMFCLEEDEPEIYYMFKYGSQDCFPSFKGNEQHSLTKEEIELLKIYKKDSKQIGDIE